MEPEVREFHSLLFRSVDWTRLAKPA
jgi:hypothetical protein